MVRNCFPLRKCTLKENYRSVRLHMLVVAKIFVAIYVLLEIAHINSRCPVPIRKIITFGIRLIASTFGKIIMKPFVISEKLKLP